MVGAVMYKQTTMFSKTTLFTLITVITCSCSSQSENTEEKREEKPTIIELSESQKQVDLRLTERLGKLAVTQLSSDEVTKITEAIAKAKAENPEDLIPMLSYYEFYDDNKGVHYKHDNWQNLTFYKDLDMITSAYYELNYKFYSIDPSTIFCWSLTALEEDGKMKTDKIGGRISIVTTKFSCVEGVTAKFFLEDGSEVFYNIDDEFNCDDVKNFGAGLEYGDLERLAASELRAVEIGDARSGKYILLSIENPQMKRYFVNLKKIFDELENN